ncbi:MAG TPA: hypothetical protein VNH38_07020 [Candidatus Dormibacteraeota bacterium]|nr:hypothetical protein [Candidatus Dormibacteraeota bacterium]
MTADFNAELYLRAIGARALADPHFAQTRRRWGTAVFEAGAALVATGRLPIAVAEEIVGDYEAVLRGERRASPWPPTRPSNSQKRSATTAETQNSPRVITCERDLERPWGSRRIHYLAFGATATSALISATVSSPETSTVRRWGSHRANWIHEMLILVDDHGSREEIELWGGSTQRYTTASPLSQATEWIDAGGIRLSLAPPEAKATSHVEAVAPAAAAQNHLWRRMSSYFCFFPLSGPLPLIDISIATLVAAGDLAADSPVINQVRSVALAFTGHPCDRSALPVPWKSLLRGWSRGDGPVGAVAIGTALPPIDDTSLTMEGLASGVSEFRVYVTIAPAWRAADAPVSGPVTVAPLAWWATDDRGNHYLGAVSDIWRLGSADCAEGSIRFWPGIDPQARQLRILPATDTQRAVCVVPLPPWSARD